MKQKAAAIVGALCVCVAVFTLWLCAYALRLTPLPAEHVGDPEGRLQSFLQCLQAEQWEEAYGYLYGYSDLGFAQTPEDGVNALFWQAQKDAWDFQVQAGLETDGVFLKQTVTVGALDMEAIRAAIAARVQVLLADAVEQAKFKSDVYDDSGDYRPEVAAAALRQAETEVLRAADQFRVSRALTVAMRYFDGDWYVDSAEELVTALTSGAVE